jgi:hypothetical protein
MVGSFLRVLSMAKEVKELALNMLYGMSARAIAS